MTARLNFALIKEATRLTREGRLDQAMAALRDALGARVTVAAPTSVDHCDGPPKEEGSPALTIVPPSAKSRNATPEAKGAFRPRVAARLGIFDQIGGAGFPQPIRDLSLDARSHTRTASLPAGARFENHTFANEAGSRAYKLYVPSGYAGKALPLVVMLHGCTQSSDDFAAGTCMNQLAEEQTFLVAYPAQAQSANAQKCWNWFQPGDQRRDAGEPSLIAGITREIMRGFAVDPTRVYIAGLSAGGAAAAVMGSTYPDIYAAIAVHSGLARGAAHDMPSAFRAMRQGGTPSARVGTEASHMVPTIVFHGDRDTTVHPKNGALVIEHAKTTAAMRATVSHGQSPGGVRYTRTEYADAKDRPTLEHWALHGAGHAWSGGSSAGSYTEPDRKSVV